MKDNWGQPCQKVKNIALKKMARGAYKPNGWQIELFVGSDSPKL